MKKIYLILFSLALSLPLYGRDPDIPLKMDVTLPSVVYFSKSDSMSTMLLYPYIYPDTMNELFIEIDPYRFDRLISSVSLFKNDFLYKTSYYFSHELSPYPNVKNGIEFDVSDMPAKNFNFSVYSEVKSTTEKHYSVLNFNIFKRISSDRYNIYADMNQLMENERTSGSERMLIFSSICDYKIRNTNNIFFKIKYYDNHPMPVLGYANYRELYRKIYLGVKLINEKPTPYANIKFYFHNGYITLFYNPTYKLRNFYNLVDSVPGAFIPKEIYLYKIEHFSGIAIKFSEINIFGNFGDYRYFPYFDTLTNTLMQNNEIKLIKSGCNINYVTRNLAVNFEILNNFACGDTLPLPDFYSSVHFKLTNSLIKYEISAVTKFDYFKNDKFIPLSLSLRTSIAIKLSENFIASLYGEYTPYYKVYGKLYTLPAYDYGILLSLNKKGF